MWEKTTQVDGWNCRRNDVLCRRSCQDIAGQLSIEVAVMVAFGERPLDNDGNMVHLIVETGEA